MLSRLRSIVDFRSIFAYAVQMIPHRPIQPAMLVVCSLGAFSAHQPISRGTDIDYRQRTRSRSPHVRRVSRETQGQTPHSPYPRDTSSPTSTNSRASPRSASTSRRKARTRGSASPASRRFRRPSLTRNSRHRSRFTRRPIRPRHSNPRSRRPPAPKRLIRRRRSEIRELFGW
jgi:hypothetical protein